MITDTSGILFSIARVSIEVDARLMAARDYRATFKSFLIVAFQKTRLTAVLSGVSSVTRIQSSHATQLSNPYPKRNAAVIDFFKKQQNL